MDFQVKSITEPTAVKTTKPYPPGMMDLRVAPPMPLLLIRALATLPEGGIFGLGEVAPAAASKAVLTLHTSPLLWEKDMLL
jgi:hypothetical protein